MTGRVVVIGDALIDEVHDGRGTREFVGGAALNVAVGLSRLGVAATLIAMVGDDEPGAHIRATIADHGVDLLASPAPLGTARAVSTRRGTDPEYRFNQAARARRVRFDEAEVAAIAAAPITVVSGFPFDDAAQTGALSAAVAGRIFAIDANPRADLMRDRAAFVAAFEALAAAASVVKVGEDDARLLYDQPLDWLRPRLVDLGTRVVLATYGPAGAALDVGTEAVTRPASALPGRIVDTMGTGDAAFAVMIASLLERTPQDRDAWGAVLERAMDAAAATCRFEGAELRLPSALRGRDLDRIGT